MAKTSFTAGTSNRLVQALMGVDVYHTALGRFMSKFSETEATMQEVLWRFAGVQSPTAQAIFSGVRIDAATNHITRIANAQNWSKTRKAEWKKITDQLSHIKKLRNDIAHYGATWQGKDSWLVTNKLFAHTPENVTTVMVSPSKLDDASADLDKMEHHLIDFAWGEYLPPESREAFSEALKRAWRYKPPPQAGRAQKPQSKSRRRRRQRETSRA